MMPADATRAKRREHQRELADQYGAGSNEPPVVSELSD